MKTVNRRDFLGSVAAAAGAGIAAAATVGAQSPSRDVLGPPRAPEGRPLRAGLIGCGGRGRGAMMNFLDAGPNLQIVALSDVFPDRLEAARQQLKAQRSIDLPASRCFEGFDGVAKLIADPDVDIVLHATPPHFRPAHFAAAIAAGKHVFMEKPVAVDPVGVQLVLQAAESARAKNLSVMTGTQLRRELPRIETRNRVVDGMIGDVLAVRAFRNQGALWYRQRQAGWSDMEYMIRDWVNWNWLSGDQIVEMHIHHLDAMVWVMGKAPVRAVGMGARLRRQTGDQYDFFTTDYTFDNGVHMHSTIRQLSGCANVRDETLVGTKGSASLDQAAIFDRDGRVVWKFSGESNDALVQEHADLVTAIRSEKPINTARDTAISTLVAIMGRETAYTGKLVTMDEMMTSSLRLGPTQYALGPVNVPATAPIPGQDSAPLSEQ
jgi:myo-inositol 2-dehydrogenase / D-chiro-inositol 1-dehydrogenase